jgi:hypothetical protein
MKRTLLLLSPILLAVPLALSAQQADRKSADPQPAPDAARQEAVQAQPSQGVDERTAKSEKKENCDMKKKGREDAEATSRTET